MPPVAPFILLVNCSFLTCRSGQQPAGNRVDLASHTLALSPQGKLQVVALDPHRIRTRTLPANISQATEPTVSADFISPVFAGKSEAAPEASADTAMATGFSASAGANSPGASASLHGGAVGGNAEVNLSSPDLASAGSENIDSLDTGVEGRSKRKGKAFSLPGFGRKNGAKSKRKSKELDSKKESLDSSGSSSGRWFIC